MATWIIGTGGSHMDDVWMDMFDGTTLDAKKHLLKLTKECRENFEKYNEIFGDYDSGTETMNEIDERFDGSLYAYVCFKDSHVDFVAKPLEEIIGFDFG